MNLATFAASVLGNGTVVDRETVRILHSLGPETAHVSAVTDPSAARGERMQTRREWPDSAVSDVPDRYPLFEVLGDIDMVAWPALGTAVDETGRVAAHLRDAEQWILIDATTAGQVVIEQQPSGAHIVRAMTNAGSGAHIVRAMTKAGSGHEYEFVGPKAFLEAVGRARTQIEWQESRARAPQDRG